ncbi:hypothetical protein [Pseudarthrobacter sp. 1C304]|uniref:hypothetical protein n=1 Tax=Pseudarthrobacter sp. 1C304 TaxID=3457438 RepID=UPI003FD2435B
MRDNPADSDAYNPRRLPVPTAGGTYPGRANAGGKRYDLAAELDELRNGQQAVPKLLEEIEDLAVELKRKVTRFASFCEVQPFESASAAANAAAVEWAHEALEDIAATALGMELASGRALIRAGRTGLRSPLETELQDLLLCRDFYSRWRTADR